MDIYVHDCLSGLDFNELSVDIITYFLSLPGINNSVIENIITEGTNPSTRNEQNKSFKFAAHFEPPIFSIKVLFY